MAQIWQKHRGGAQRHSPGAYRLLRSTIWYERAVALFHHRRFPEALWCLCRSMAVFPARGLGFYGNIFRRGGTALARPHV